MNCIVQIRILRFFLLSKALLPYDRILVSLSWLSDGRDLSIIIKSFIRISRILLKNWHYRKKCNVVLTSMLQGCNGFKVYSKLCRNLCSCNWLSPNVNLLSNFIPTWSWNYLPVWDCLLWSYLPFYIVEITCHEITYIFTLLSHIRLLSSEGVVYCQSTTCTTCLSKLFFFLTSLNSLLYEAS